MDWSVDQVNELTRLWGEGLKTGEIGKRLGISKNAVIGKAHRLHLKPRPSPIVYAGPPPTLDELRKRWRERWHKQRLRSPALSVHPAKVVKLRSKRPAMLPENYTLSPTAKCQYIAGEPMPDDSCKCLKPAIEGKAWCPEHFALVYTAPPARKAEAA